MFQGCIIPRRLVPMTTNDYVTIKEMKGKILGSTANHDTRIPCYIDQLMLSEQDYIHAISDNTLQRNFDCISCKLAQKTKLKPENRNNFSSRATELSSEITVKGTIPDFDNSHPSSDHSYNLKRRENTLNIIIIIIMHTLPNRQLYTYDGVSTMASKGKQVGLCNVDTVFSMRRFL